MNGESVVHIRYATSTTDANGDAVYAEVGRDPYTAPVYPRMSSETDTPGRTSVVIGLTLHLPRETAVDSHDRFLARGNEYQVSDEPADYRSPWTSRGLVVVNLTRVEG